jgi:NitT/TauT family transport system substrate-binding protein
MNGIVVKAKALRILLALPMILCVAAALPAQDKKLTTINLGYSAISGSFAPLWVGFDQGLFAKHGIDLKMAYIQGNRVMLSALTAGEIHIYQGGAEGLIRLVSGGGDGIFIATQYNVVNHYVLMTDPSITRLEELRGKRLALDPTSPTYGYMLKVLEQVGLKKEDVSFVQFGTVGQPERAMAVMRKQAAATILTAPNTYAAEKQGLRKFSIIRELGIRQLLPSARQQKNSCAKNARPRTPICAPTSKRSLM